MKASPSYRFLLPWIRQALSVLAVFLLAALLPLPAAIAADQPPLPGVRYLVIENDGGGAAEFHLSFQRSAGIAPLILAAQQNWPKGWVIKEPISPEEAERRRREELDEEARDRVSIHVVGLAGAVWLANSARGQALLFKEAPLRPGPGSRRLWHSLTTRF